MTLEGMHLFDLAARRKAYELDPEVILGIVAVRRDLAPVARYGGQICEQLSIIGSLARNNSDRRSLSE